MTSRVGRKLNKLTKGGGYAISLARLDALLGKRDPIHEALAEARKFVRGVRRHNGKNGGTRRLED
jgi:hypothetical protein